MPNTIKQSCCYQVCLDGKNVPCNEPVKYKMVEDEYGTKVRDYDAFCPYHCSVVDTDKGDNNEY